MSRIAQLAGLIALGMRPTYQDPRTGRIVVDDNGPDVGNDGYVEGYDDGGSVDGEEWVDVGARRSKAERRYARDHRKEWSPGERRDRRYHDRHDGDDGVAERKPKKEKAMRRVPIGKSVAAAVAWTLTITPPVGGTIEDLVMDAPSGTIVNNISTGLTNAISGQEISATLFANTSFSRDVIKGLLLQAAVPLIISGTGTATTGSINCSFVIRTNIPVDSCS